MKKVLALLAGFASAVVAGGYLQGCGCTDLPQTVYVDPGTYGFADATPPGYTGYSLVVAADAQGTLKTAVESYTLNGAPYVSTYQFRNTYHVTLTH
jgi:hypothetical protein